MLDYGLTKHVKVVRKKVVKCWGNGHIAGYCRSPWARADPRRSRGFLRRRREGPKEGLQCAAGEHRRGGMLERWEVRRSGSVNNVKEEGQKHAARRETPCRPATTL